MEGLILKTVQRIRRETPRRLRDLRIMCDELIGMDSVFSSYLHSCLIAKIDCSATFSA